MRRAYRKHHVLVNHQYIPVKDWYRNNPQHFQDIKDIPNSEQIGLVLKSLGFKRTDSETAVIYNK
jgi:hypothetical protein